MVVESGLEVTVGSLAAGGDGIARHPDGRVVFVPGGLPGEKLRAEITAEAKGYVRARLVEVVDPSPDRVVPPCCEPARGCGGCQWQHVDVMAQRRLKAGIVIDALRRIAHANDPPVDRDVPGVEATGYRTTLHLGVEGGRASYRRRHGHEMVAPATCMVAHPMLASMLFGVDFGPETTGVVGRVGIHTGDRLMVLAPRAPGLTVPAGTHLVGRDRPKAVREAFIHEVVSKRRWRISADSFFQSGPQAAELLIDVVASAVADALPTGGVVLDAYAGVGILGGELARTHGARVVAVESNRRAVSDARANLADLDATVIHGQVADQARWLKADPPALASHRRGPIFDVVVADPARPGLGKAAAAGLAALGSPRLVLASCDPASMARDVALLATHGYELTSLTVLDLFPDTFHVETVARFDLSRWTH